MTTFLDLGTRTGVALLHEGKLYTFSESLKCESFLRPEFLYNIVKDFTCGPIFFESATGQQGHAATLYAGLEAALRCAASSQGRSIACVHQSTLASFYGYPKGIKNPSKRKEAKREVFKYWLGDGGILKDIITYLPEEHNEVDALALACYVLSGGATTKTVINGCSKDEEDLRRLNSFINKLCTGA